MYQATKTVHKEMVTNERIDYTAFYHYDTFLKMQQLRECQFSKTVALVREKRTRQSAMFALSKLAAFLGNANCIV